MHATIAALVALTAGQWIQPRIFDHPNLRSGNAVAAVDYHYFEWDPAVDGTTARINGVPSLALTYTRSGSMFCANSDNTGTTLSANQPCIAQGGILVEAAGTNQLKRSQEFDNAYWLKKSFGGPSAPTVTADYAIAPDGTMTADRFVSGGCATADSQSYLEADETFVSAVESNSLSFYVRATSGGVSADGGEISAWMFRGPSTRVSNDCAFPALSPDGTTAADGGSPWVRCSALLTTPSPPYGFNTFLGCNNYSPYGTGLSTNAMDVLLWGAQAEAGTVATSYKPTTSAAVGTGNTLASFTFSPPSFAEGCIGTSIIAPPRLGNTGILSLEDGTTFVQSLIDFSGLRMYVGGTTKAGPTSFTFSGSTQRFIGRWSASASTHEIDGTVVSGAAGTPATWTNLKVGNYSGAQVNPGRYSRVVYDPRPTRCGL